MYKAYWNMSRNTFTKEIDAKEIYMSEDARHVKECLEHVMKYPGIALITGAPGGGKTLGIRCFTSGLNPNLYKVVYQKVSNVSETEFFRMLSRSLGLEASFRRGDNIEAINERMRKLYKEQKVTAVIIIDEAQGIRKTNSSFFLSLQEMMNFDMDSRNYGILVLSGHPVLNHTLSLEVNEAFNQRISANYEVAGMTEAEVCEYVRTRMELACAVPEVFDRQALSALHDCHQKSVRRLNRLCVESLKIGADRNLKTISSEVVREAAARISLV